MFKGRKSESGSGRAPLPARTADAARTIARQGVDKTRDTVHKELLERARAAENLSDDQIWRRYQGRHLAAFLIIPAVILGTASIATAYGTGLIGHEKTVPVCQPEIVPAPKTDSFKVTVMNAAGINGAGHKVGRDLSRRGFNVVDVSSAPRTLYVKAPAKIFYGKQGLDQALLAAQTIDGAELEYDGRAGTSISFVIGADFTKMLPAPPPKDPELSDFSVNVYNTTWRPNLATEAMAELKDRGFTAGKFGGNPDGSFLPDDVAIILHGPDADLAAKLVQPHFKGSVLKQVSRDNMTIDVMLGNKYEGVTPVAELPKKPVVRKDPPPTVTRPCS